MNKRYKKIWATIGSMGLLAVIFDSFPALMRSIDYFLKSKQLTVGTILMLMVPFFMIVGKLSKEKEKKARAILVERRQLQIAFNINEIMEALKVESKWSLQEIGSTHAVQPKQKKLYLLSQKAMKHLKRRVTRMNFLKTNISKKLIALIVGVGVTALNTKLGLNLSQEEIYALLITVIGYIAGQSHVDAKKAVASTVHAVSEVVQESIIPNEVEPVEAPLMSFQELIPYINDVGTSINTLSNDLKTGKPTEATKDAINAIMSIHAFLKKGA
jgi:hypothetical protein